MAWSPWSSCVKTSLPTIRATICRTIYRPKPLPGPRLASPRAKAFCSIDSWPAGKPVPASQTSICTVFLLSGLCSADILIATGAFPCTSPLSIRLKISRFISSPFACPSNTRSCAGAMQSTSGEHSKLAITKRANATTSTVSSITKEPARTKSRKLPINLSAWSTLRVMISMCGFGSVSSGNSSAAKRIRDSGLCNSCDTPARRSARSSSAVRSRSSSSWYSLCIRRISVDAPLIVDAEMAAKLPFGSMPGTSAWIRRLSCCDRQPIDCWPAPNLFTAVLNPAI